MNNEQVGHYVKSLGKLISQVGEYLRALDEKAEIEQQHQCLDKIQQQLDQLQQQTLYILINSLEDAKGSVHILTTCDYLINFYVNNQNLRALRRM